MKKSFYLITYISLFFSLVFILSACTKTNADNRYRTMSFVYNNQRHEVSEPQLLYSGDVLTITLDDPAIFRGTVYFSGTCAYFAPTRIAPNILVGPDCNITLNWQPIDSSEIYIYKSGSMTSKKSNCKTESGTDIFTGNAVTETRCELDVNFDLILQNNKNQTMTISDGKLHIPYY